MLASLLGPPFLDRARETVETVTPSCRAAGSPAKRAGRDRAVEVAVQRLRPPDVLALPARPVHARPQAFCDRRPLELRDAGS